MRLYELIDFNPRDTKKHDSLENDPSFDRRAVNHKGSGHFSQVYRHNDNDRLNQVRKYGTAGKVGYRKPDPVDDVEQDGYLSYLKMIHDTGDTNPFFPRFHDLEINREPGGKLVYKADIEKLVEYTRFQDNFELIDSIRDHLFHETEETSSYGLAYMMQKAADGDRDSIKDPKLKDAMSKIDAVAKKGGHNWDLGSNNMMWRITGNMPQLVITDPLS